MFDIFVQALGIFGMASSVISQQCHKNRNYFIFQIGCNALFLTQFLLTGSYTGMILNSLNIFRSVFIMGGEKFRKTWVLILMEILYTASTAISIFVLHDKAAIWLSVLVWLAQLVSTVLMWSNDGKKMRMGQLFAISPAWLIYDAFAGSIGGVLCEVFNIISVIVSFIRYRKVGFDNK